jgi:hypothetical protein
VDGVAGCVASKETPRPVWISNEQRGPLISTCFCTVVVMGCFSCASDGSLGTEASVFRSRSSGVPTKDAGIARRSGSATSAD